MGIISRRKTPYSVTPNLGYVFPVPGVPLKEGSLQLGEHNPQWSSAAFEEEPFSSLGSGNPKCLKVLQLDQKRRRMPTVGKRLVQ